jgi:Flp pilus assembly protein TadB
VIAVSIAAFTALCLHGILARSVGSSRSITHATRSIEIAPPNPGFTRLGFRPRGAAGRADRAKVSRRTRWDTKRANRIVATSAGCVVSALLLGPFVATTCVITFVAYRRWRSRQLVRRGKAEIELCVPEVFDLMATLLRAGLSPALATAQLARAAPLPVRDLFRRMATQHEHGERFADLLAGLAIDVPPLRPLCETLIRAERYGDPLGPIIDRLGDEARQRRRRAAETSARQLPVRLCFPLVCCTLPAFVLLTIVPLVAGALSSLRQSF